MAVDALDEVIERQIKAAKRAIVDFAKTAPDHWWTAFELKKKARNGWSAGTMGLAFYELLDEKRLEQRRPDLRVRVRS